VFECFFLLALLLCSDVSFYILFYPYSDVSFYELLYCFLLLFFQLEDKIWIYYISLSELFFPIRRKNIY